MKETHSMVMSNGNLDKIIIGCYENYLNQSFVDISLEKVCHINEWLYFHDIIEQYTQKTQSYELFPEQALVPVYFKLKCCTVKNSSIKHPKVDYEVSFIFFVNATIS